MPGRVDLKRATAKAVHEAARLTRIRQLSSSQTPPFSRILCAVDGSRGSTEAVHQAIRLCRPGAALHFVAVSNEVRYGRNAQVDLSERRAREALDAAASSARLAQVEASTVLLHGAPTSDLLLAESAEHDLLVIGSHGGSRFGGVVLGSTAAQIAHRAEGPMLLARRTADGRDFPRSLLLATDGSPGSWAAARVATRVSQAHDSELRLVHVPDGMHPEHYREVLKQVAVIEKATGSPPRLAERPGNVIERIDEAARAAHSSLIVIGRRGVSGLKALGSASERVVHKAQCSVLVVPAAGGAD